MPERKVRRRAQTAAYRERKGLLFILGLAFVWLDLLLGRRLGDRRCDGWDVSIIGKAPRQEHVLTGASYTLLGILPTNTRLEAIPNEAASAASRALIETWGNLHAVRTALGFLATIAYLWALHLKAPAQTAREG